MAGFMTEYSGIRWSFFFMEEYAAMFLYSAVGAFFFFGGFESPLTWGVRQIFAERANGVIVMQGALPLVTSTAGVTTLVLASALTIVVKGFTGVFLMMWLRWTLPRVRIDQVMTLGYKYLTPLSLVCVLGAGLWEVFLAPVLPWRHR
jgi:NADH-quinone oxidoreductase subunit H